ncbi:MAG: ATP-binding cassette domain-containing protein [bacterium]|nr:ATP-binding cassette domain-containing protein [bacterium]
MREPFLRVDAVLKEFGKVRAVDRLGFTVRRGEIFAFLGPNGAGKSTTVRMLVGILRPDAGRIQYHLDGETTDRLDPSLLGYLPEDRGLYPEVPLLRTLTYMGTIRGMERRAARDAAMEWLERLGLADRAEDKLDALSKGNQQKVQFIAAVLHKPAFAVLDEPFSGLDPLNQDLFLDILRDLRDGGTTVLLSAHQMPLVERVADRVLLMSRGREVLSGTIEDIKAEARTSSRIFLELAGKPEVSSFASHPAVAHVERQPNGELAIELEGETALSSFLAAVAGQHEIRAIRSAEVGLHEIFVRQVKGDLGDAGRADQPVEVER